MSDDHNPITDYWHLHYVNPAEPHCTLCGNTGVIDTRGVCTPAGLIVGRLNWCICPNGQSARAASPGELPIGALAAKVYDGFANVTERQTEEWPEPGPGAITRRLTAKKAPRASEVLSKRLDALEEAFRKHHHGGPPA